MAVKSRSSCAGLELARAIGLALTWWAALCHAGADIPVAAPNCLVEAPPSDAGAYVTPGGFLLVFPRNAALPANYTGCKAVWLVDGPERMPLVMRLYFAKGRLAVAHTFDSRSGRTPAVRCDAAGADDACRGLADNPLAQLHLPTWPRRCIEEVDQAECSEEPR